MIFMREQCAKTDCALAYLATPDLSSVCVVICALVLASSIKVRIQPSSSTMQCRYRRCGVAIAPIHARNTATVYRDDSAVTVTLVEKTCRMNRQRA
jgi:hypothetical protein